MAVLFYLYKKEAYGKDSKALSLIFESRAHLMVYGSLKYLEKYFGCSEDYISNFDYEIHSWSGKYDIDRQPVSNIG